MPSVQADYLPPATAASFRFAPWAEIDEHSALAGLGPREQPQWDRLRNPRRRREWLAGRTLAKQLIADERNLEIAPRQIEIVSSAASRRPQIWIRDRAEPRSLSIAHSSRGVLVALARRVETRIGVDLTERTPLSESFVRLWFTADERAWLGATPLRFAANRIWAAKEALYKACNRGEGFDPRQIEAIPGRYRYRSVPVDGQIETFTIEGHVAVIAGVATSNYFQSSQPNRS